MSARNLRAVSLALLLSAACGVVAKADTAVAVDPLVGQINQLVEARMAENQIPGYALTVIKNGQIILHRGYGMANAAAGQPVTNETVFGLASCTKTFTAITLLSLVDKGLVNLEDPVGKYVSGLSKPYAALTLRQLASMTGGVPKVVNPEVPWVEQIPILNQQPLMFQPGSQFLYSNFSYRLLGSVIERVTGKPYLQVVGETILGPAQMGSTATTDLLARTGRVAQAYGAGPRGNVRPVQYKSPAISFSAGMLATTNDDFAKYAFALLGHQFLSAAGYKTLWMDRPPLTTGAPSPWAFGFSSSNTNKNFANQRVISMNGATPGVASLIMLFPDSNSGVVALCNLRKPESYAIGKSVARLVFGVSNGADEPEESHETPE